MWKLKKSVPILGKKIPWILNLLFETLFLEYLGKKTPKLSPAEFFFHVFCVRLFFQKPSLPWKISDCVPDMYIYIIYIYIYIYVCIHLYLSIYIIYIYNVFIIYIYIYIYYILYIYALYIIYIIYIKYVHIHIYLNISHILAMIWSWWDFYEIFTFFWDK